MTKQKDKYTPSVAGVGFLGEGTYKSSHNYIRDPAHLTWTNMIKRCYDTSYLKHRSTYKDCEVVENWHNYQNFAKWFYSVEYKLQGWHLDKDLLVKGNRVYGPNFCVFLPAELNNLILLNSNIRGDLPIGVTCHKKNKKYKAQLRVGGKNLNLPLRDSALDSFLDYKKEKERYIKVVAQKWKGSIDPRAFSALLNYEVSIND